MKLFRPLVCLAAGLGLSHFASAQTTLFSQNFDTLGATSLITNSTGALGSGTGQFNYNLGSQQTLSIADKGSGNYAVRLSDNNTAASNSIIQTNFTGVSTTGTGNNILSGSFDFTPLALSNGSRGNLVFGIATANTTSTGPSNAVQFFINADLTVNYTNGVTTVTVPSLTLVAGTSYRIGINANFGSDTQDTWGFSITNTSTSTELSSLSGLSTRGANITPGSLYFSAGTFDARISSDPHVELDNINFVATSAIPEPGTYALLVGAGALMMVSLRRRRR